MRLMKATAAALHKFWTDWRKAQARAKRLVGPVYARPTLEVLESRTLLTGNAANAWMPLGPAPQTNPTAVAGMQAGETTSGRVSSLAYGTYNNNPVLYLGAAGGGVWRSSPLNGGGPLTWTPLTDTAATLNANTGVGAGASDIGSIAVSGSNVYDGTGEANYAWPTTRYGTGILVSANGGDGWALKTGANGNEFFGNSISKIIAIPGTTQVFATVVSPTGLIPPPGQLANLGVYQSQNSGQTWTKISGGMTGLPDSVVTDLDYLTVNGQTVLLAAAGVKAGDPNNGIYWGAPQPGGGYHWSLLAALPNTANGGQFGRASLASDHNSTFYVAFSNAAAPNSLGAVYQAIYTGPGPKITTKDITPPGLPDQNTYYNLALGLSPNGRLYLGLQRSVLESNTSMTGWRSIVDPAANTVTPHVDHHAFAFGPDGTVYEGDDGGVWSYTPGPFDAPTVYTVGANPVSIAAADLNPNGQLDLITADKNGNDVNVLSGSASGAFALPVSYTLAPGGTGPVAVATGDFNSDGKPDLVTANPGTGNLSVLLNKGDGSGTFPPPNPQPNPPPYPTYLATFPQGIAVADFNKDGPLDLAVANANNPGIWPGGFQVYFGNAQAGQPTKGDGTFAVPVAYQNANLWPVAIAAAPLGSDVFPDIVIANASPDGTVHNVSVFINDGKGGFNNNPTATYQVGAAPTSVLIADVNGDGFPDIITTNSGDNTVSVLLGNKDGTFQNAINTPAGTNPVAVAAADFNNDGSMDLVVANKSLNGISILYGNGNGTFKAPVTFATNGVAPDAVTTGDFNHDGIPDIAVANANSNNLSVFLSNNQVPAKYLGGAWTDLNTTGLNITQLYSAGQQPGNQQAVLVGSQDNGTALSTNALANPNTWTAWSLGFDTTFVRFDPNYNGTTNQRAYAATQYGNFFQSTDGGNTWAQKTAGLGNVGAPGLGFPFKTIVAIDPVLNKQRWLIGSNTQVWEAQNGNPWAAISPGGAGALDPNPNAVITALAYAPSNDNTIYVGFNDGQIFVTQNDGGKWSLVSNGLNWGGAPISSIAVDPNNNALIYVSTNVFGVLQVWSCANTFAAPPFFNKMNNGLPNVPVNALVLDAAGANLYAGTDVGVYSTPVAAVNWAVFGKNLPNVQVLDLQLQTFKGVSTFLAAATHGRGVWIVDPPTSSNNSTDDARKHSSPLWSSDSPHFFASNPLATLPAKDTASLDQVFAELPFSDASMPWTPGIIPAFNAQGSSSAVPDNPALRSNGGGFDGDFATKTIFTARASYLNAGRLHDFQDNPGTLH